MAPSTILSPSEFDIKNISYSDVVERKNGSKVCYPLYNNKPIYFQTPQMYAPFGISSFNNEPGVQETYSMNLSFQGMAERKSVKKLFDVMESIDKSNVKEAFDNCSTWLNKKKVNSLDVVEALYSPIVREPTQEKYSATMKLKLPYYEDMFKTTFYDKEHNIMNIKNHIADMKGSKCKAVIMCTGVWFIGGKFGCTWQCEQVECILPEKMSGYVIKDIPEDNIDVGDVVEEDEEIGIQTKNLSIQDPPESQTESEKNDVESDSDDDDDDDDDTPVPVVVKKKK
jgi:hypothetical protein|tara:strand:+ start:8533 stop:9381 length:849 start_codon:yes stop_codon:yes gene_type:complete